MTDERPTAYSKCERQFMFANHYAHLCFWHAQKLHLL